MHRCFLSYSNKSHQQSLYCLFVGMVLMTRKPVMKPLVYVKRQPLSRHRRTQNDGKKIPQAQKRVMKSKKLFKIFRLLETLGMRKCYPSDHTGEPFAQAIENMLGATVQSAKHSDLHTFVDGSSSVPLRGWRNVDDYGKTANANSILACSS